MDTFTHDDLKLLTEERTGICISIYLRTHIAGSENIQQDRIRFENMLSRAEDKLTALGMRAAEARRQLDQVRALSADDATWKFQSEGLAVFVTDNFFRNYRLPLAFDDLLVVTGRFHVKPLLLMLTESGEYFLLALSQKKIRLLQGTRFGLSEIDLTDVPQGVDEALTGKENEAYQQHHVRSHSTFGGRPALFYGQGESKDDSKDRVTRYFRRVDESIQRYVRGSGRPLVIAGVEYLLPLYREINTYPDLLTDGITGNAEDLQPADLHAKAWPLIEQLVIKQQEEAQAEFHTLQGTGKASTFTPEIVPASLEGRVSKLLVTMKHHEWGTIDRANAGAISHFCKEEEQGCEDLYDFAAIQTLLKGGKVYMVESESVTDGAHIAAVYRY